MTTSNEGCVRASFLVFPLLPVGPWAIAIFERYLGNGSCNVVHSRRRKGFLNLNEMVRLAADDDSAVECAFG